MVAKVGFDTAENEPPKIYQILPGIGKIFGDSVSLSDSESMFTPSPTIEHWEQRQRRNVAELALLGERHGVKVPAAHEHGVAPVLLQHGAEGAHRVFEMYRVAFRVRYLDRRHL